MVIPGFRLGGALAAAVACLMTLAGVALAQTRGADLRVVNTPGKTLADFRQYTGTVEIKADPGADCFGQGTGGSGDRVRIGGSTALGAVRDALGSESRLRPLSVTDAFADQGFGLGVCGIGGYESQGSSFWYVKRNHVGAQVSGSQLKVHQGDDILWYLSPGFPPPLELALAAPVRAKPNVPFAVTVHSYADDGTRHPAAGVSVTNAAAPTGPAGHARVSLAAGTHVLRASDSPDIPSNRVSVCVAADPSSCPSAHGKRIVGSDRADEIKGGTPGWDSIEARGGKDTVDVTAGGHDLVGCGGGSDRVILNRGDHNDRDPIELRAGDQEVTLGRALAAGAAVGFAAALAGCGFGPGQSSEGIATLTVTRDYGAKTLVEATDADPPESESVIRLLDRQAEITTRYGGGFVAVDRRPGGRHERRATLRLVLLRQRSRIGGGRRGRARPRRRSNLVGLPRLDERDAGARRGRLVARALRAGRRGKRPKARAASNAWPQAMRAGRRRVASRMPACGPESSTGARRGEMRKRSASWSVPGVGSARTRRSTPFGAARPRTACSRPSSALPDGPYRLVGLDPAGSPARDLGPARRVGRRPEAERRPTHLDRHRIARMDAVRRAASLLVAARASRPLRRRGALAWRIGRAPARAGGQRMRSPLAYTPRHTPLGDAGALAASVYLGSFAVVAFVYSNPIVLAGAGAGALVAGLAARAGRAVAAAARWGLGLGVFIVVVNALVAQRGDTVIVHGIWLPLLGTSDVSAEAVAEGAVLAARILVVLIAFAIHAACVDPDRVLRMLRPLARRSALTATLIARLVPLAAADYVRLGEAAALRGPGAAPSRPWRARPPAGGGLAGPRRGHRRDPRAARLRARRAALPGALAPLAPRRRLPRRGGDDRRSAGSSPGPPGSARSTPTR